MSTRRFEALAYTPRQDPNYPGIPILGDPPAPPLERVTSRPAAEFSEYVLTYTRLQRTNTALIFTGMAVAVGAAVYLGGGWLIAVAAIGLGLAGSGAGGFVIAAEAHSAYTRHMAVNVTSTYATPPAPSSPVRAFVPSTNGDAAGHTIRAGRFSLPATTWAALFDVAEANGGRLTRDAVAAARALPRALYRDWAKTVGELARLGIQYGDGMVTADGWTFAGREDITPPPQGSYSHAGAPSTHARRTHGAHGGATA